MIMDNIVDGQVSLRGFLQNAELQQYYELFRDILKVRKLSQLKYVGIDDLIQIGLSRPEQRRFKKVYSKIVPNSYITKIKKLFNINKKNELVSKKKNSQMNTPVEFPSFSEMDRKVPTKHIIPIEHITINKELGTGQFGVVQQGTWATGNQRLQVAIKCLGNERVTSSSAEFLKEAAVMHSIDHPNIVRLYGVVLHLESLMLVTELAPLRSLLECLHEVTLRSNFSVAVLCNFAEQICDGMCYLENKRLIHRDLAARNILVFNKDCVKISDFGLSRALGVGKDYYQTNYNVNLKLPVAWCAPECILYLKFTSSSDVWAFGVCLWEMFTYGFQPWAAFSGQQILEAIDAPNFHRLERPECCPDEYYTLMLECWSHEIHNRPKFKDLVTKLRQIRPEEVQTTVNYRKPEDGRRANFLEFKAGQNITVLAKESFTKCAMWYGALPGGACGFFDPKHIKPYVVVERGAFVSGSLSPHPNRNSSRSIRSSLLRSDVKRHTYTGKRAIERSMISSPQGDVKHTGHVGLDGAYFGDLSFLDPTGCPPRQVVTPYKPLEDLEHVPLINPNSPSHLTATSTSPYLLLSSNKKNTISPTAAPPYDDGKCHGTKKKTILESKPSKSLLSKVKSATMRRSHKSEDITMNDEVHEYQEITDADTEGMEAGQKSGAEGLPESPGVKSSDFSQSLLDEMETMFRNLDDRQEENLKSKHSSIDTALRTYTSRKKKSISGTMKPMSAHDKKTLDTAVALANEITSKSMNDLESDQKPVASPSERSKFPFKFPSLHQASHIDPEKEASDKAERRNFSEEAKSVPDIQATITKECKQAYESLIEKPTTSSLMSQIQTVPSVMPLPAPKVDTNLLTVPKLALRPHHGRRSQPQQKSYQARAIEAELSNAFSKCEFDNVNVIPLPPRGTKPKLVDKPRHYRKYPLRLLTEASEKGPPPPPPPPIPVKSPSVIYQNTIRSAILYNKVEVKTPEPQKPAITAGTDVCDGRPEIKIHTNPFKTGSGSGSGSSSANPFIRYLEEDSFSQMSDVETDVEDDVKKDFEKVSLTKDHVSVEDLLEFADQKPSARQRGVESDEVRIMSKVLKKQVTPEECLDALEFSGWNVHIAIKLLRVKISVGDAATVTFEDCRRELEIADGDLVKASAVLVLSNKKNEEYPLCFIEHLYPLSNLR